jgi:hypothetical protein
MSRPPLEPGDIFDEMTQLSPASQSLPRAEPVPSAPPDPVAISSQRHTRPTVHSPILAPPAPATLAVPPTLPSSPRPRTIPLRAAVIGLVVALAAGTLAGFEAHRLLSPAPPAHAGAHR